jgi:molybdopterin-guanine dinucleotide biosynthesis protein A
MTYPCTGVILAGGNSLRLHGKDKSLIKIGGKSIFERIYDLFTDLFQEIVVVSNTPLAYLRWNVKIVTDLFPFPSSLTGLHTGLFYTETPYAFFSACDTPFLKKDLVKTILAQVERRSQVVVPTTLEGLFQPLCAVYAKTCIGPIEAQLTQKKLEIAKLFKLVKTKTVSPEILCRKDPELISFFNLNTVQDVKKAISIQKQLNGIDHES